MSELKEVSDIELMSTIEPTTKSAKLKPLIPIKDINSDNDDDDDDDDDGDTDEEKTKSDDENDEEEEEEEEDIEEEEDVEDLYDEDGELIVKEDEEDVVKLNKGKSTKKSIKTTDIIPTMSEDENDEDDDDDEEDDENYLQKFDGEIRKNFIEQFHPDKKTHNYEEVRGLCTLTKNEYGFIQDPLHKTLPFLTKYEKTRILGQRAKQINSGAKPFVKVPNNIIDGYSIALIELAEKKIPFIIKRPLPDGSCEYWRVSDLELIN
jgi:DNA-directed RNA polymerase subunit K/omega